MAGVAPEEFWEPLVDYNVGVRLFFEGGSHVIDESNISDLADYGMDGRHYARLTQLVFAEPSLGYTNGTITLLRPTFNMQMVSYTPSAGEKDEDEGGIDAFITFFEDNPAIGAFMFVVILALIAVAFILGRKGGLSAARAMVGLPPSEKADDDQTYVEYDGDDGFGEDSDEYGDYEEDEV